MHTQYIKVKLQQQHVKGLERYKVLSFEVQLCYVVLINSRLEYHCTAQPLNNVLGGHGTALVLFY